MYLTQPCQAPSPALAALLKRLEATVDRIRPEVRPQWDALMDAEDRRKASGPTLYVDSHGMAAHALRTPKP